MNGKNQQNRPDQEKLLVVDVGNTDTVIGLFEGPRLTCSWRVATGHRRTGDEWASLLDSLIVRGAGGGLESVRASVIGGVVPPVNRALEEMFRSRTGREPLLVSAAIDCGLKVLYQPPMDVGADRLANALAAYRRRGAAIVLDFGTATTLDAVTNDAEYLGGAIMPGITISLEALYSHAARLSGVDLYPPDDAIGKNTGDSLRSGAIFGFAAQADGMVRRFRRELGLGTAVIATGGLAALVCREMETEVEHLPLLTIEGLKAIYDLNRSSGEPAE